MGQLIFGLGLVWTSAAFKFNGFQAETTGKCVGKFFDQSGSDKSSGFGKTCVINKLSLAGMQDGSCPRFM
jgi:hypothetical protein